MNKRIVAYFFLMCLISISLNAISSDIQPNPGWRAGVARLKITPEQPMPLAGFVGRNEVFERIVTDVWVKALAFEDIKGNRSVLITFDLATIRKSLSDRIRDRLKAKYQLSKDQIILNVSHTHSSVALYSPGSDSVSVIGKRVKEYTEQLEDKIVDLAGRAINSLQPVQIFSGNGIARFQVNRRNNGESTITPLTDLKGPNDYSVPVIKVVNKSGKIIAVAFGYACHNTVIKGYELSGDYAGFAQLDLEKANPGTTALFFQGCGGNLNPLPRQKVALAEQYGQTLASAVQTVLSDSMQELSPNLTTIYKEISLPLAPPLTKGRLEELVASAAVPEWVKGGIRRDIAKLERGESLPVSYPTYPIQVWKLGEQTMIMLGGEPVVEYAIRFKEIYGPNLFVLGYSNEMMTYIPTSAILREGDYEGGIVQLSAGLRWSLEMESYLISQVVELARKADVVIPDYLESSLKNYRY